MGSKKILWIACSFQFVVLTLALDLEEMSIEEYVDYINPPAVHKFKNDHGDSILCVNYDDQIFLRHHKNNKHDGRLNASGVARRLLNISPTGLERRCPEGTVSIMEVKHEQVKAAGSVASFLRRRKVAFARAPNISTNSSSIFRGRRAAFGRAPKISTNSSFCKDTELVSWHALKSWLYSYGLKSAQADFNVWQPIVADAGGSSGAQLLLTVFGVKSEDYIMIGWDVDGQTAYEGESPTRLMGSWTTDGFDKTGCDNSDCPGFVAVPFSGFYLGMPFSRTSQFGDKNAQVQINIRVVREARDNNAAWVLYVNGKCVGYWPATLFRSMVNFANVASFGGVVQSRPNANSITRTDMGSGYFPTEGYSKAAYIGNVRIVTIMDGNEQDCTVITWSTNQGCYDTFSPVSISGWDNIFFFGGPGGDDKVDCL